MKALAAAIIAVTVLAASTDCMAQGPDPYSPGPYAVIGDQALFPTHGQNFFGTSPQVYDGTEVVEGYQFNRYYAVEGGAGYAVGTGSLSGLDLWNVSADAIGLLPFGRGSHFALMSDMGAAYLHINARMDSYGYLVHGSQGEFAGHFGAGAQYQFNSRFGIRVLGQYEITNLLGVNDATIVTVGFVWRQ